MTKNLKTASSCIVYKIPLPPNFFFWKTTLAQIFTNALWKELDILNSTVYTSANSTMQKIALCRDLLYQNIYLLD